MKLLNLLHREPRSEAGLTMEEMYGKGWAHAECPVCGVCVHCGEGGLGCPVALRKKEEGNPS